MFQLTTVRCACVVAATFSLVFPASRVACGELSLWHKVEVSRAKVMSSTRVETHRLPSDTHQVLKCCLTCLLLQWCKLLCVDQSTMNCTHVNTFVTPTYLESDTADGILCFTRRPMEFATMASIITGKPYSLTRSGDNLIDGFYNFRMDECLKTIDDPEDKWFVIDVGRALPIRHVLLVAQSNTYARKHFVDFEVRVGTSPVTAVEGISAYTFFGHFPGPGERNEVVILESPHAMKARFVSVQKMSGISSLQVCHVEIY
ncbi:uncharacterized protein [Panulirus ornatus]|uniref:uncharacterized protein n=1 Tax=Panulirus ornatus TaxID=150431 RepID=UPI003A84B34D